MQKLRVLMTAGGSGGHIYPMTAVAIDLQHKASSLGDELDLRFFGQAGSYKEYLIQNGFKISSIAGPKLRRYGSIQNFLDFFVFFFALAQAFLKVYWFMPDVVFSKSGSSALPVILAARWYRIPLIIHESDAIAGLTNRIAGKMAKIIELAFENARQYFPENKTIRVVGNPIRKSILAPHNAATSRERLGLPHKKPVLLFIGGSGGAQALNYFVLENSEAILNSYEVIQISGTRDYEGFKKEFDFMAKNYTDEQKANYHLYAYLEDAQMADALNAADLIISRAGSSIFEIAAVGKPSILIPLPGSANGHQDENAAIYAASGAAVVIEQDNLLINLFLATTHKILGGVKLYPEMCRAAKAFYKPEAATVISQDIITIAHPQKNVPQFAGVQ